jgi:3-hydroxybutyryl-CoA dehydratase
MKTMKSFQIGDEGRFSKTISESDVYTFAGITGDFNPLHINKVAAEQSRFGRQVVHGALVSAFVSTVLGIYMPGPGTIYLEQKSAFVKPVYIGDTVTAVVTISEIDERRSALLDTKVYNQAGELVLDGYAKVKLPKT